MRRLADALLAAAALAAAGCASDFPPASFLDDLRVLAIVASPLDVAPGQAVTLAPTVHVPTGSAIDGQEWTFCPLSVGSVSGYACAAPACETTLATAASGPPIPVTANPTDLALACLAGAGGAGPAPGTLPEVVETVFRYTVTAGGQRRVAVQLVPLWTRGPPPDPTLPPAVQRVEIGGVAVHPASVPPAQPPPLLPGGLLPVRVVVDPSSVQTYLDGAGVLRTETVTVSYFSTAGRLSSDRATGVDVAVDLEGIELRPGEVEGRVWVVVRDLRGGQEPLGPFAVPIQP